MSIRAAMMCAPLVLGGCSCHSSTRYVVVSPHPSSPLATSAIVRAEGRDSIVTARFRNVNFHVWPGVALRLDDLHAQLRSRRADGVVSFDDPRSFVVDIDEGTVGLSTNDLGRLMNTYVFAYQGAPLRDLTFEVDGNHLVQHGVLHKVVDIPFTMTSDVSVTNDGEIRVHPVSMKICTIPGNGLLAALGITLAKLLDLRGAKGVRVEGNDLLLDPAHILPPPAIAGRLESVFLERGMLVQRFASHSVSSETIEPDSVTERYMLFRGGTLEFGKLFMVHADMEVVALTPGAVFDFDINRYHEQLVGGYHRTLDDDGLLVFMPSLDGVAVVARTGTPNGLRP